jgi:SAM-dependent methyltransferase
MNPAVNPVSQQGLQSGTGAAAVSYAGKPDAYYVNARPEMLAYIAQRPGRVLDVGCGGGRFGEMLKDKREGAEVWGVEPMAEACAKAALVLDRALHGLFNEALGLPEAHFDTIVFNDSLEHFPDPLPPLALARRLLAPQGRLVVSVPNVRHWPHMKNYLFRGDWRYEDEGILDHTHLRFFTQRSIVRTLGEAGFTVQRVEGVGSCWRGLRRMLAHALLPRSAHDIAFLQIAAVAVKAEGTAANARDGAAPAGAHP